MPKNILPDDATFSPEKELCCCNDKISTMKKYPFLFLIIILSAACTKNDAPVEKVDAYRPVYISKEKAFDLKIDKPAVFEYPGKMFLYQNLILITDNGNGIHIIDNTNPSNPKKVAFIAVPGVVDATVKNGILYADNFTDLVAFDISNPSNITFKKRIKNLYPVQNQMYPEFATGYFECVDTTKGYVLRWEKVNMEKPDCFR